MKFKCIKLLVLAMVMCSQLDALAQSNVEISRFTEFTVVRIKHGEKKSGITASMFVEIPSDGKNHSLAGQIENRDNGVIGVGTGENMKILRNEADLLTFFAINGWNIVMVTDINILSTKYVQYVFGK